MRGNLYKTSNGSISCKHASSPSPCAYMQHDVNVHELVMVNDPSWVTPVLILYGMVEDSLLFH